MVANKEVFETFPLPGFTTLVEKRVTTAIIGSEVAGEVALDTPIAPLQNARPLFDLAVLVQEIKENREEAAGLNRIGHRP